MRRCKIFVKNIESAATSGVMTGYGFGTRQDGEDRLTGWARGNGESATWDLSLVGDWDRYSGNTLPPGGGVLTSFDQARTHNLVHELLNIDLNDGNAAREVKHDSKVTVVCRPSPLYVAASGSGVQRSGSHGSS